MAGTDFSHLTNDELIKGIQALKLPDYIRSKAYGVDVRETLAQMTEMTIQLGVNMGLSPEETLKWARKLQESVSQSDFDSWVATLLDGGPSIFMNTLSELQTTYPNGAAGVALVRETDPAKIYVWNGSLWEDFGDYQGIEIKDGTVTNEKIADGSVTTRKLGVGSVTVDRLASNSVYESKIGDGAVTPLKTSFMEVVSFNKFNVETRQPRKTLNQYGEIIDNANYFTSAYIPTKIGDVWKSNQTIQSFAIYDEKKVLLEVVNSLGKKEFTSNHNGLMRFTVYDADGQKALNTMISNVYLPEVYEPFKYAIKKDNFEVLDEIKTSDILPVGKNILDTDGSQANTRLGRKGKMIPVSTDFNVTRYLPVEPSTTYTCSSVVEVSFYDKYGKTVKDTVTNNTDPTWTFNTTADTRYIKGTFGGEGKYSQIEKGTVYTGYEKVKYGLFSQGRRIQTLGDVSSGGTAPSGTIPVLTKDPINPVDGQIWILGGD